MFVILFTGLLIGPSCKKSPIPVVSSISATVNGQPYHNSSCTSCLQGLGIADYFSDNVVNINSEMIASGFVRLNLTVQNVTGLGSYSLSLMSATSSFASYKLYPTGQTTTTYVTDATHSGTIVITKFDTVHHIISGTFQFDAVNSTNSSDVVHVTNGQFTILYTP